MAKARSSAKQSCAQAQQSNGGGGGHALSSKLARYLDPEASWNKDQLLDAVHWIRQAVGLICGLLWGAVPLVGAVWIALKVMVNDSKATIPVFTSHLFNVDEADHRFMTSHGLYSLLWFFYSRFIMLIL
ncbi:uncharacterized protein [Miscanthus floridulus]|uniref:uncharacterized protein n=1 Tax=Miscanthus floridulus TaxID=154761 RepID=UPI003458BC84